MILSWKIFNMMNQRMELMIAKSREEKLNRLNKRNRLVFGNKRDWLKSKKEGSRRNNKSINMCDRVMMK